MKRFKVYYAEPHIEGSIQRKRLGHEIVKARNSKEALKRFAEANTGKVPLIAQVV